MEVERSMSESAFHDIVKRAKEYIEAGDIFQVVLSQQFQRPLQHQQQADAQTAINTLHMNYEIREGVFFVVQRLVFDWATPSTCV